jgi:uncharacterized protein
LKEPIEIRRNLNIHKNHSFLLFGARGTGKSTLLKSLFKDIPHLYIDLLLPNTEEKLQRNPESLREEIEALPKDIQWVVLDEVQKVPKLLNLVHYYLEKKETKINFALTGSSGKKLRKGSANLLAGRAFVYEIFPFTSEELAKNFNLKDALCWGTLPSIFQYSENILKQKYLQSYVRTYISEEIQKEQVVKNIDPFRFFLELSAQYNGKIINYTKIAKGIGVDPKTVASYYQILEETLLGSFLLPFHYSFRKKLLKSPKFFFFDLGVCRTIARELSTLPEESTSYYGELFEAFVYNQIHQKIKYQESEFKLSYYKDENDIEVDFVIERPKKPTVFIELKSTKNVNEQHTKNLRTLRKDFPNGIFQVWSQDPTRKMIENCECIYYQTALSEIFN